MGQSALHLRTVGRPPLSTAQHRMSGTVETELRKLEKIVPGLDKDKEEMEMEEILELTVAYIAELQNHLVGRVRTHGEKTFRKLNKNIRIGANLNEKSSKEDIIKFLHKISTK